MASALRHMVGRLRQFPAGADGIPALLVGRILSEELEVSAGDYVTLTSPQGNLTPFGMLPRSRRFRVAGIFDSGFYDYDANWGFVTLASAQALAGMGDVVSLLEVRVIKIDDARTVADELLRRAGPGFIVTTWMDENRALFRALSLEKLVTALFIGLITFVAGLNILVVLTMTVTDRARDIAVLMAMGHAAPPSAPDFHFAGAGCLHWRNGSGTPGRVRIILDCQSMEADSSESGGVCNTVRSVPREWAGRDLDSGSGFGYQRGRDDCSGMVRCADPASRNSSLRIRQ